MATKVAKVGVKKVSGYLYFVDKKGVQRQYTGYHIAVNKQDILQEVFHPGRE